MSKGTNLPAFQCIPKQVVSSGTITSTPTQVELKDNITFQFVWDGTLAGTFDVQTSLDGVNWDSLTFSSTPAATGSPNHGTIEINQLGSKWIQVVFTWSAGSGNLTATVLGKVL